MVVMAMLDLNAVHLGTSSWQFDAWRGVFYPEKLARTRYLPYYASQFDTVEVNTSFYALPAPSTLVNWVETAPDGFTFALKFPRSISHDKRLVDCGDETRAFLDALRALGSRAAPAFLQLPPDCTRRACGRVLATYLDWLAPQATDLRLAVEVRAADLMTPAFATFVAERGLGLVLVDRQGTADLFPFWQEIVADGRGPGFAFIRWIGDDRSGPTGDRDLQVRRDDDLAGWAARIAALAAAGKSIYGYMHNPYEGHAPASVRRLLAKLAEHGTLRVWPAAASGTLPLL
jgi:uncharacterized protein YecE (DUF72 family)